MLKNVKIATKISILVTVVLLAGFLVLWKVVDQKSSSLVENQITNQMKDAVESRAYIINNYVETAEEYMIAFSKSDEVRNVLLHPEDEAYLKRGQQYTVDFANVKGVFEGLYIASPETYIYTHTSEGAIGITTREGEALKQLQDTMMKEEKITNLGIMKSPGTGNMCISMYYPLFEDGKCIGYVGSAVYARNLMESLKSLEVEGLPESEYVFLNANTGEYLYNENEELLCTVTEDIGYLKILDELKASDAKEVGMVEYIDENGVEQVVVYRNIPERNWVFALKDTKANVYSSLTGIKRTTAIVCIVTAIFIILVLLLILSNLGRQLKLISNSIEKLGEMDLDADKELSIHSGQKDEVGIICDALERTCTNLKQYIGEVDWQLSAMSEGDFRKESHAEFAGAFIKLQNSMKEIHHSLRNSFWEINTISSELVAGSQSVSDSSSSLAEAATRANVLISEIDEHVEEISKQLAESAEFALHAKEEANDATQIAENSREKMDELMKAMALIEESTKAIESISSNLEGIAKQTNILALNALVEANRAGDAGRGFSVVANEIRDLAEQSSKASLDAFELIKETVNSVEAGIRISSETAEYLEKVVSQTETIDVSVSKIAENTNVQNEKLQRINDRLQDISQTVETTAAMAEQSAAASVELDDQINALRENIKNYKV